MSAPDQMVREVVWKITPPMSRKSTFTDDPEEVAFIRKSPGYTITEYRATPEHPAGDAIRDAALEEAAKAVPTSWLHPLLTGPRKVVDKSPAPEIEALLRGIADAIRALRGRTG